MRRDTWIYRRPALVFLRTTFTRGAGYFFGAIVGFHGCFAGAAGRFVGTTVGHFVGTAVGRMFGDTDGVTLLYSVPIRPEQQQPWSLRLLSHSTSFHTSCHYIFATTMYQTKNLLSYMLILYGKMFILTVCFILAQSNSIHNEIKYSNLPYLKFSTTTYCLLCQWLYCILQPPKSGFCHLRTIAIALPHFRF